MIQLLAQRMGLSSEQYDALRTGNPAPLLGNQGSDPLMAALLSSMLARKPENTEADFEAGDDHAQCQRELLRAKRSVAKLKNSLASADAMVTHIADMFGACEFCWGLNKLCPRCGGRGGPGFTNPKQEGLLGWGEPALQKL